MTIQQTPNIHLSIIKEREQADVTFGGLYGGKPDVTRKSVPGPFTYRAEWVDDGTPLMVPLTEKQAETLIELLRQPDREGLDVLVSVLRLIATNPSAQVSDQNSTSDQQDDQDSGEFHARSVDD